MAHLYNCERYKSSIDFFIVRILQRRGDLVEFAYLLVAVFIMVIQNCPDDVTCEVLESKSYFQQLIFRLQEGKLGRGLGIDSNFG